VKGLEGMRSKKHPTALRPLTFDHASSVLPTTMAPSLNVFQLLPLPQVLKDSLQTHLSNPLNLVLFLLALYLIALSIPTSPPSIPHPLPSTPSSYNWRPKQAATGILWRSWTPEELHGYDGTEGGKEDGRILFAIRRKVYDVTSGKNFYGPGAHPSLSRIRYQSDVGWSMERVLMWARS
jgi:predicted heme/steroid binding protein